MDGQRVPCKRFCAARWRRAGLPAGSGQNDEWRIMALAAPGAGHGVLLDQHARTRFMLRQAGESGDPDAGRAERTTSGTSARARAATLLGVRSGTVGRRARAVGVGGLRSTGVKGYGIRERRDVVRALNGATGAAPEVDKSHGDATILVSAAAGVGCHYADTRATQAAGKVMFAFRFDGVVGERNNGVNWLMRGACVQGGPCARVGGWMLRGVRWPRAQEAEVADGGT